METDLLKKPYTENLLHNGWFKNDLDDWKLKTRGVAFDEVGADKFLAVDGTLAPQVAQQIKVRPQHTYYLSFEVALEKYGSGFFGVQVIEPHSEELITSMSVTEETTSLIKHSMLFTNETAQKLLLQVGCENVTDCTGKIGKLALYDLTEIFGMGNELPLEQFDELLQNNFFIESDQGIEMSMTAYLEEMIAQMSQGQATVTIKSTDSDKENAFIQQMNQKAHRLGMTKTNFVNAHGSFSENQLSTAHDLAKLLLQGICERRFMEAWGAADYSFMITGENAREAVIENAAKELGEYTLLGARTGLLSTAYSGAVLVADEENNLYTAVLMNASSAENCERELIRLIAAAKRRRANPEYECPIAFTAASGVVNLVQQNPLCWTNSEYPIFYSFNKEQEVSPGTLTKLMTALVMLDHVSDLAETFELRESDVTHGSGPNFAAGDVISYQDALYLILVAGSNTATKAVARTVGDKVIQARGTI